MPSQKKNDKDPVVEAPEMQAAEETVQEEVNPLEKENAEIRDQLLRTLAEYDNFRKRSQRERENLYPEAMAAAVVPMLGVIDNFERALAAESTDENFKKGMEMIFNQMIAALEKIGVKAMETDGQTFDPNLHNAVMHIEDESYGENVIVETFQKGYLMGERVIRFAVVKTAN